MNRYGTFSDDHYVNLNLHTEMELPQTRDAILHYFEQMRKHVPALKNFYNREKNDFILEEDKDRGTYRWVAIENKRLSSGYVNPPSSDDALKFHTLVLDVASYCLSMSPIDCESLNITYGFDYTYRGNHNQLLVDALGVAPAFAQMAATQGATVLGNEPSIQLALDEDCRTQVRLSVEPRTTAFHVRMREYPEEQISVYLTARRYGSLEAGDTYLTAIERLNEHCRHMLNNYVVESVLRPLQQAIAIS